MGVYSKMACSFYTTFMLLFLFNECNVKHSEIFTNTEMSSMITTATKDKYYLIIITD